MKNDLSELGAGAFSFESPASVFPRASGFPRLKIVEYKRLTKLGYGCEDLIAPNVGYTSAVT